MKTESPPSKLLTPARMFVVLILGFLLLVGCLLVIGMVELTNRETTLLGIVLTLMSIAMGWGISHYYAIQDKKTAIAEIRDFEQRNLRTFALKAAEKVTNLSKELNRLSNYLNEELQFTEYRNAEEELFAKEERIESAIHLIESLRSMNETSLSDWQGVIGEELDERRENVEAQKENFQLLFERIDALERHQSADQSSTAHLAEIDNLKKQLRFLASAVTDTSFRANSRPIRQKVSSSCPVCEAPISYEQRAKENDHKAVQCKNCSISLISTYRDAQGFDLKVRKHLPEDIICPKCEAEQEVSLDSWPSASTTTNCEKCSQPLRVTRLDAHGGIRISQLPSPKISAEPLSQEVIEAVTRAMPAQPWPKGVHFTVAAQINLRPATVQKAISHLIRMGVFMDQVDGVVCTTAEKIAVMRSAGTSL